MHHQIEAETNPGQSGGNAPFCLSGFCRSFFEEFAALTGLKLYFLAEALKKEDAVLPREVFLGCPLLGGTGFSCEECPGTFHNLLSELKSNPDRDWVSRICPAGLSIAILRLPSGTSQDALLVGQTLPELPSPNAVHQLRRKLGHRNDAELDFEYLCHRYASVVCMDPEHFEHVLKLMNSIRNLLTQLPSQLLPGNGRNEMSPFVKKALEELHLHYCEDLIPGELAGRVGVTPRHLARTFKDETGQTIGHYLKRLRVAHMVDLLRHSHASVNEAAFASGFQSISAAYRAFHQVTGEAPTHYVDHADTVNFPENQGHRVWD